MQYTGMIAAFLLIIAGILGKWWSGLAEFDIGAFLYLIITPTVISTFFVDNRVFKDVSRFLLGVSFTTAFILLIVTPDLLVKGWILINFIPGYLYFSYRREKKNRMICLSCNEFKKTPYCSGYRIYAERENIFLDRLARGSIRDPLALPPDSIDEKN